ncbi:transcription activator [endosymbiont of Acanthamoeba sp. UWC8]|uniref:GyrI-like domain-containing protein n=1 Tax=endosymbiont of Acanthamoeba sp. UWC8 TaxID=86106 RepID=UPI0004D1EE36|nr:GyrI-like domain-containing protein [endosymbiont of Acanthamoeba sp. UWC8]AIF81011.1 transcription activator [endosymbiont of Acanthamoeba sp. UWC8]
MKRINVTHDEIKLIGIKVRTSNKAEFNPSTAKIGATIERYFINQIAGKVADRKNPGTTICLYMEYESDMDGEYSYFIGEEVTSYDNLPEGLNTHTIPSQTYVKFTTQSGVMPNVVINAWQQIWQMSASDLGGIRSYRADFEIYDTRSKDPNNTIVDIYIGIKS